MKTIIEMNPVRVLGASNGHQAAESAVHTSRLYITNVKKGL